MHGSFEKEHIYPSEEKMKRPDNSKPKHKDKRKARKFKQKVRENVHI